MRNGILSAKRRIETSLKNEYGDIQIGRLLIKQEAKLQHDRSFLAKTAPYTTSRNPPVPTGGNPGGME